MNQNTSPKTFSTVSPRVSKRLPRRAGMFDPKDVTIGQWADYLVFDPDGLTGEPRYEVGGKRRPLSEGYAMFFSAVGPELTKIIVQKMDNPK
jgi:hypothetical protein